MDIAAAAAAPVLETPDIWSLRVRAALALSATCAAIALFGVGLALAMLNGRSGWWAIVLPVIVVPAAVGLLIVLRRPGNAIGWVLLIDAVVVAADFAAEPYARYGIVTAPGSLPAARWALLWDAISWPTLFAAITALVFLFPDGRVLRGRWGSMAMVAVLSFVGLVVAQAFQTHQYSAAFGSIGSPLPTMPEWVGVVQLPIWIGALASPFAAVAVVHARFRRAAGTERLQLLWLAYAALMIPATLLVCVAEGRLTGGVGPATAVMLIATLTGLPLAVAVALFRYRLLDIELVLSRTLVYGLLTVSVVTAYIGLVVAFDLVVQIRGVAGATAAALVALAAQPLRHSLQRRVARLVYGSRSDPYAALSRMGQSIEAAAAQTDVLSTLVDSIARALRLAYSAIELERDDTFEVAASHGAPRGERQNVLQLTYRGQDVGRLVVEPPAGVALAASDRKLLGDLARQAGVAVHAARLTADLQRSRELLVTTREEERRRLRRDLHDGLGPALASIVLKVDAVRTALKRDSTATGQVLDELRSETQGAILDIRRLVYDLRPPALDELGLMGALREQATKLCDRSGVRIAMTFPATPPSLPAAVEVAAYRIAVGALMNATQHASARMCSLNVSVDVDLLLEIADDGVGLPSTYRPGVGLLSMRERAEELGGTCEIGPRRAGGTLVRALIPLVGT